MKKIAETERLILRELDVSDAEVLKHTGDIPFKTILNAELFLENYSDYATNSFGRWAVILKSTNEFLGWCGLKLNEDADVDLGFRFFRKHWGKGYATEAARAALTYGFDTLHIPEIIGRASSDNSASIRVLEKTGMTFWKRGLCNGIENAVYYRISDNNSGNVSRLRSMVGNTIISLIQEEYFFQGIKNADSMGTLKMSLSSGNQFTFDCDGDAESLSIRRGGFTDKGTLEIDYPDQRYAWREKEFLQPELLSSLGRITAIYLEIIDAQSKIERGCKIEFACKDFLYIWTTESDNIFYGLNQTPPYHQSAHLKIRLIEITQ